MEKAKYEKSKWASINILASTIEEIRRILPKIYGYHSVAEYVADAVRRKLESDRAMLEKKEVDELGEI